MSYLLCWLGETDINELTPVADLDQTLRLARDGDPESLANLVRLNWMVQDLKINAMIKPLFCRDQSLQVIVGDTRIMAARLAGLTHVPVMAYLQTPRGSVCHSLDDIKRYSGFQIDARISWTPTQIDPLCQPPGWIDIGDQRTRHHGHDQTARLRAIQIMQEKNPQTLDINWIQQPKDWGDIFLIDRDQRLSS